jgi:hypothetical protein
MFGTSAVQRMVFPGVTVLVAAIAGTLVAAESPSTNVVLLVAIAGVLAAPVVLRVAQGRFDPFEPVFLFAIAFGVMFVVRPAAAVVSGNYGYGIGNGEEVDFLPGLTTALAAALVGALAFIAGYLAPAGEGLERRLREPPKDLDPTVATLVAGGFAGLGILSFVAFIVGGGGASAWATFLSGRSAELTQLQVSSSKYVLFGHIVLLPSTLMLFTLWTRYRNPLSLVLGSAAGFALLLLSLPTGSRSLLFPLVLGAAMWFYLERDSRPRLITILIAAALALIASSVILMTRNASSTPVSRGEAVRTLVRDPLRVFDPITSKEDVAEAPGFAAALSVPRSLLKVDPGEAVLRDLVVRPVPRSLWTKKPVPPRQAVTEALFSPIANTLIVSPEFSILLYPYLDAGFVGVALLLLLLGVVLRALYVHLLRHPESMGAKVIFVLAVPALVGGVRDSPVDTLARLAILLVPVLVVFAAARVRPVSEPSGP